MNDAEARAAEIQPAESKLSIIWAAMSVSVVVYLALAWFVVPSRVVAIDSEIENWLLIFLAMSSGLHVLTVLLLRQAIAALSKQSYVNYCIMRWAFIEGIGVYGLVLALFGVGIGITSIFFAVTLLVLVALKPGASDRAAFVSQFR